MKQVHWMFVICLFTSSCDLILNVNLGGSLRLCQLLMIFLLLASMARVMQDGRILWPRGSAALALWMFIQLVLIPESGAMAIALQFYMLLLFTVLGVFAIVQLYGISDRIESLMRMYMMSYVLVGAFGLVQFVAPLLGLPAPLAFQWIIHGKLTRINGFSYEPSYFATYMIMGWIMLVDLRISKARIALSKRWKWATLIVTASLFLSTSKSAWAFMLVELAFRLAMPVLRIVHRLAVGLRTGVFVYRVPSRKTLINLTAIGLVMLAGAAALSQIVKDPTIFLAGTGLAHTPAHSLNDRSNAASVTWEAFKEHPWVGRSLGGVPVYLAARNGTIVHNMAEVRNFWGFPVPLDVLVASGLTGILPFVLFVWANTFGALRRVRPFLHDEKAKWVHALARAMIFEWLILMTDQNLMRVYVWFHITMVAVMAYHFEFGPSLATIAARARPSRVPRTAASITLPNEPVAAR